MTMTSTAIQVLLEIPSPPISGFSIGPLRVHFYALCILTGIIVAWIISTRRYQARGGTREHMESLATLAVLTGIIGARVYHVITDYQLYFGPGRNPWNALQIWQGGLGIWGGVVFGAVAVWWYCRRHRLRFSAVADSMAPAVLLAQGIGRLGNWFNQELFGGPTSLPWGLHIDPQYRPTGYETVTTFHPTFLYELLWTVLGYFVVVALEKKFALRGGAVFSLYIAYYCFGRFFIEALRIDDVNTPGGFRLNNYTSAIVFVGAVVALVWQLKHRPDTDTAALPSEGDSDAGDREGDESDDPADADDAIVENEDSEAAAQEN